MFSPLTVREVVAHTAALVSKYGPEHTYKDTCHVGQSCFYTTGPNGTGCLIGEILIRAGLSREIVAAFGDSSANMLESKHGIKLFADTATAVLCREMQSQQDNLAPWGQCLSYANGFERALCTDVTSPAPDDDDDF